MKGNETERRHAHRLSLAWDLLNGARAGDESYDVRLRRLLRELIVELPPKALIRAANKVIREYEKVS